jgi:hypothetical protein
MSFNFYSGLFPGIIEVVTATLNSNLLLSCQTRMR